MVEQSDELSRVQSFVVGLLLFIIGGIFLLFYILIFKIDLAMEMHLGAISLSIVSFLGLLTMIGKFRINQIQNSELVQSPSNLLQCRLCN